MIRVKMIVERSFKLSSRGSQRFSKRTWRSFSCTKRLGRSLDDLRQDYHKEIAALPEQAGMARLESFLGDKIAGSQKWKEVLPPTPPKEGYKYLMNQDEIRMTLDAALATFCLHVESRIVALVGSGYYTIGPCGEELLSAIGLSLQDQDDAALHYRHLGASLARQIKRRGREDLDQILLDRARGYTVSKHDPVTGGVHCSIGSHTPDQGRDYLVTSTLASQCPSAVGRALGYSLAAKQKVLKRTNRQDKPVSFVTVGDGSIHNHHFWSAFHLARHARHRSIQCPIVFGISNNGMSISYETKDYVNTLFGNDPIVRLFEADASDMMQVFSQTKAATEYARQRSAPAVIVYQNITRRFGHAASDRQHAYLGKYNSIPVFCICTDQWVSQLLLEGLEQIQAMAESDVLERAVVQAVEVFNVATYAEVRDRLDEIRSITRDAFSKASAEERVTRDDMMKRVSQPLVSCSALPSSITVRSKEKSSSESLQRPKKKVDVMRKHMTRVLEESLAEDESVVYLGK